MTKINSLMLALCLGFSAVAAVADDIGNFPGYVASPSGSGSKTILKTQYGECVHNQYYQSAYGQETCGEAENQAPKSVVAKVEFSESSTQLFGFNNAVLTAQGEQELTNLIAKYAAISEKESYSLVGIGVVGHTDMVGHADYNKRLSTERAEAVKQFLISKGIDGDIIDAEGAGFEDAEASPGCFAKYGKDDMGEIDRLTALEKKATPEQRVQMNAELARYGKRHAELVRCMAPDRRVDIYVEGTREELEAGR